MKVFTVGLDQKPPPPKEAEPLPNKTPLDEKTGTPPPGYSKTSSHNIPLPMGPEIPQPPPPIIVRKSRGYKGILMVMLAVFLMALFALIISEIAYTRQRDENFFRLRWAELKHRLGYADNIYDYYHRTNNMHANRLYSLDRQRELLPDAFNSIKEPFTTTTSTTVAPPADEQPVLAEVIDTSRPRASFASSSASSEQQHQSSASEAMIRDARLQFLRTILQGIKQHAEDMGFDGTMQVSVIEVEPQDDSSDTASSPLRQRFGGSGAPLHLPNLFSHFPSQRASGPLVDEPSPLSNVKSSSFLDGFGEFHQPSFAQNNRIAEQNRVRLVEAVNGNNAAWPRNTEFTNEEESQQPQQQAFNSEIPFQWTRVSAANADPFRQPPPLPPLAWNLLQEPLSQTPQFYQQQQQPQILPRPPVFFNGILVDGGNGNNNENEIQQPRRAEVPLQMFPLPTPISPVNGVSEMMAQQSQHQQPMMMANRFDARHNAQGMPNEEALGEMYGFKVGRMLQDIIANRLHGFQNLQQQQQQQQASSMIAPEDRVQVEPPMFIPHIASQQLAQENDESNNNNNEQQRSRMVVDNNIGWTHQQQPPLIDNEDDEQPQQQQPQISKPVVDNNNNNNDNMESMRNFQKMMTAAAVIEQQQQQQPPQISKSIERPPQQQSPQPQAQQQQFGSAATSADSAGSSNEAGNSQSMADHWIHVAAPMFMGAQAQDKEETTAVKRVGPPQQQPQPQQPMFLPLEPSDNKNTNNGQQQVDFPAVKFPLNAVATSNRESENSNNNEDEKNEENKPLLFSKQETEQAQQNDDESVQSQQQHSPAVGGRANPVFFQVDDPTSAEQPSVVPRRPLI